LNKKNKLKEKCHGKFGEAKFYRLFSLEREENECVRGELIIMWEKLLLIE